MRNILNIAKAELRYLFYSPIAWFLILIFYIFTVFSFLAQTYGFALIQEVYFDNDPNWLGFEQGLSDNLIKLILRVLFQNIYLFIPLLTMALINREITDRTFPLLYSTPIKTREIVLGKYLGVMLFNLILILLVVFALTAIYFIIEDGEYKWFFAVLLGLTLLLSAYTAIGMFVSSLTKYQIVAAVCTFILFYVFDSVVAWGKSYDIIRDITYFLFISDKTTSMMAGLISTANVSYFLLIITLFVGATIIRLKSQRESKRYWVVLGRYSLLFGLVLFLGVLSSNPKNKMYLDLTNGKTNTIHPAVQASIKELDGSPLKVTLYTNLLTKANATGLGRNRHNYIYGFWEQYLRFYPNIEFEYCNYYYINRKDSSYFRKYPNKTLEEIVQIEAELLGVDPKLYVPYESISDVIDLTKEAKMPLMVFEYKGRKSFLRTYNDSRFWPEQKHFAASIKRLTRIKEPSVLFSAGHLERDIFNLKPRDYAPDITNRLSRGALINNGVDADTISLAHKELPRNLDLLVIADPKTDYSDSEITKIRQYIHQGGNAILITEPGKAHILQPIADSLGITLDNGVIVMPNANDLPHKLILPLTNEGNRLARENHMEYYQNHNVGGAYAILLGALNLNINKPTNFEINALISAKGEKNIWIENGTFVSDSATPTFSIQEGDIQKEEYTLSASLTRSINNKQQRIIIIGDGDLLSRERKNLSLGLAFYSWPLNNDYPIYTNYPPNKDKYIAVKSASLRTMLYFFGIVVPVLILIGAIILLVRRKRK